MNIVLSCQPFLSRLDPSANMCQRLRSTTWPFPGLIPHSGRWERCSGNPPGTWDGANSGEPPFGLKNEILIEMGWFQNETMST